MTKFPNTSPFSTLRPNVFGYALDFIRGSNCWHLDAWLYAYGDNVLLKLRTGEGMAREIGVAWFVCAEGKPLAPVNVEGADTGQLVPLTLGARGYDWLGAYHKAMVARLADDLWPRGDYKRRSVCFWYALPTRVNDPCEGLQNWYALTGRKGRDEAHKALMLRERNARSLKTGNDTNVLP